MSYDVVIIGAGIASYSAALMLNVYGIDRMLIIGKKGGHILNTPTLYNYPGINECLTGQEFYDRIDKQIISCNINVLQEFVTKILNKDTYFIIKTENTEIEAKIILIATGLVCEKPFILDIDKYKESVFGCISCSNNNYDIKNKKIIIIGGADNAFETALLIDDSNNISIISRSTIKASPTLIDQIKQKNIKIITYEEVTNVYGENNKLVGLTTNKDKYYECDIIIYAIGHKPAINFITGLGLNIDKKGYIKTENGTETNIKNVFACGSVSNDKYLTTSAIIGFGAMAATDIYNKIIRNN